MDAFKLNLYHWYRQNQRVLPWREITDPYLIWVSEIILQQTRIVQGVGYYQRLTEKYPTLSDLANAPEDAVLKVWQGLGYYSRARNMHFTAKFIVKHFNGKFPSDYKTILSLKGVGEYTAAAIASIAFNIPEPAVDGNVSRVISRVYGVETAIDSAAGKKEIVILARELLSATDPGLHNQAMMEFGALQCVPTSPNCKICPMAELCFAFQNKLTEILPVKAKKTVQRNRYFYYYMVDTGQSVVLEKRIQNDIWKNLYQFPLLETENELTDSEILSKKIPGAEHIPFNLKSVSGVKKHILSHQVIYARLIHVEIKTPFSADDHFFLTNKKDIYKFAVSRLMDEFIKDLKFSENRNVYNHEY